MTYTLFFIILITVSIRTSQVALVVKNLPANAGVIRDAGSIPGLGRSPGEGNGNPLQLPGKSHGQGSLAGYSPQGLTESHRVRYN